jgi:hypothetical protein
MVFVVLELRRKGKIIYFIFPNFFKKNKNIGFKFYVTDTSKASVT